MSRTLPYLLHESRWAAPNPNVRVRRIGAVVVAGLPLVPIGPPQRFLVGSHAMDRVIEMGVSRDELTRAVLAPEISYPSHGREVRVAGRLAVVVIESMVVTVKWRGRSARGEGPLAPVPNRPRDTRPGSRPASGRP